MTLYHPNRKFVVGSALNMKYLNVFSSKEVYSMFLYFDYTVHFDRRTNNITNRWTNKQHNNVFNIRIHSKQFLYHPNTKRFKRTLICVCASPVVLRYRTTTLPICHFHSHSHPFLINSHRHWGCSSVHVLWHVINSMIIKTSMWMA